MTDTPVAEALLNTNVTLARTPLNQTQTQTPQVEPEQVPSAQLPPPSTEAVARDLLLQLLLFYIQNSREQ